MIRIKKHYHWLIIAVVLVQLMIHGGINNNFSLFILPVSKSFQVSRSAVSVAGSLKSICSFLCSCVSGLVLVRFGYRKSVCFFLAIAAAGLGILSFSSNLPLYYLGFILFGLTQSFCIAAAPSVIINSWFVRYRGALLGIVSAATGLGGSLICILFSNAIETSGWHRAYLYGAILLVTIAILVPIIIRDHPKQLGLTLYGEGEQVSTKKRIRDNWAGFTYSQLHHSPLFYVTLLCTFLAGFFAYCGFFVLVPHLQDQGLTPSQAAAMQSVFMLAITGTKTICGFLSDLIGVRKVFVCCLITTVISLFLFTVATTPAIALIAVLIYSFSPPITSMMAPLMGVSLFGTKAQTSYVGFVVGMISLAGMLCEPIANLIYDAAGSYNPFLLLCSGGAALMIGCYLLLYRLANREKQKILAVDNP